MIDFSMFSQHQKYTCFLAYIKFLIRGSLLVLLLLSYWRNEHFQVYAHYKKFTNTIKTLTFSHIGWDCLRPKVKGKWRRSETCPKYTWTKAMEWGGKINIFFLCSKDVRRWGQLLFLDPLSRRNRTCSCFFKFND